MPHISATLLDDLAPQISGTVLTDDIARAMYSTAAGIYQVLPLAVVRPRDVDDIAKTLRWCTERNISATVRGGGTSLLDACLGSGIIIDTTAHMGRTAEIDVHDETVTAPAGANYARINQILEGFNRHLPPDPPSGDCCTIGGLIATNASGITSIRYGSIINYVESLELVLADGTLLTTGPLDIREPSFKEWLTENTPESQRTRAVYNLLREHRALIRSKTPNLPVNSSGYRLERTLGPNILDLGQLITGSEGTLAVITKAKLRTVERPPLGGIILLYFENVQLAADSVRPVLDAGPCAVELLDARSLELIRATRPDLAHFLREKAQSVLIVEFDGADNDELIPKLIDTQRLMVEDGGTALDALIATAEPDMQEARELQRAAWNALHNLKGPRRVTPFVEDIAVAPDMVSSCIHGLCDIMKKHNLDVVISGHAGQGSFSARPLLDLKNADDIRRMREIAEEVFAMVVDMGGTISGGSGDGLARTEFLRLQYGELCDVFTQVKHIFDPNNTLNPGIKVSAERGTIVSNLRYGPDYSRRHTEPRLLYRDEPREDIIEKCHGCGVCRTPVHTTAMCPLYKVLQTEEASPRAKANILRHLLSTRGTLPPEDELVTEMQRITDLCLNCKMCSVECPSSIDVAKLVIELRARRAEKTGFARDEKIAKLWPAVLPYLATFPLLGNLITANRPLRYLAQRTLGIAAKRKLPPFRPLELKGRKRPTLTKTRDRVILITDPTVDCCTPEITQCTLNVLIKNSTEIEIISGIDSGAERFSYGDIKSSRKLIEKHIRRIAPLVADGFRVISTNPRITLFFRKTILDCLDTPDARAVAAATFDLMQFLLSLHRAGRLDTRFRAVSTPIAYHAPCHLRALQIGRPSVELLRLIPELPLAILEGGCCGMAGTFGLRQKNYDLSLQIARPIADQLRTLEVRYGLTECPSCAIQLQQTSGKHILHPIQILHRAYGLREETMPAW